MEENISKNIIIIKYCLPLTAVSFIIFLCGFFCDDLLKTSLWSSAVFSILVSLVIYCFTFEKITNEKTEIIENLKYESKIISNLHYKIHLINPEMKLKDKISFSLRFLTENLPESTFVCYSCLNKKLNFIAASRLNSRKQTEKIYPEDPLISEISTRIKSMTDYESLRKSGGFEKPIPISNGRRIQGQIFIIDFYSEVLGILVELSKTEFSDFDNRLLGEYCKSIALVFEDDISFESQKAKEKEVVEVKNTSEFEAYSQSLYSSMFPNYVSIIHNWDFDYYYAPSPNNQSDFLDIINLNTEKQMIIYGKCSGHGINASTYVNNLKIIIRCFVSEYQTPASLLNKVSSYLNSELMPDVFVDVTALTFSSSESQITVAMAGNTVPIINRTRSGFAEIPELSTGIPLGLFNQGTEPYKDQEIQIMPGDGIVLHTDGITDLPGKHIERLNNEDLKIMLDKIPERNAKSMLDNLVKLIKKSKLNELPEEDHSLIYLKAE